MRLIFRVINVLTILLLIISVYFLLSLNNNVDLAGDSAQYIISTDRTITYKGGSLTLSDSNSDKFVINSENYAGDLNQYRGLFTVVKGSEGTEMWNNNGKCNYFKMTFQSNKYILNLTCFSEINEI